MTTRCRSAVLSLSVMATVWAATAQTGLAQTYTPTSGASTYNDPANWTPNVVPNAVGASATFQNPTAAQTINLGAAITVGSFNFTNNANVIQTLANGTGGSLTFDAVGSGPATVTVNGTSTTTNSVTISASVTLADTLQFVNNDVSGIGAATTTMTGTVTGAGGFIKDGPGRFTFSTVAKAYTGATVINQGRLRYTASGQSTGTSSLTVNSGGSLYLDQANGSFSFGAGGVAPITISGDGDNGGGTGTQGAIRNQGSGTTTLASPVALGSNATIHSEFGTLQLSGAVSGSATLTKSGAGTLQFVVANPAYTGGTTVTSGTVLVNSASQLGTGALAFAQTAGSTTTVTLNNAAQAVSNLSSTFVDVTGTLAQTLNLNGTALTVNQTANTTFGDRKSVV